MVIGCQCPGHNQNGFECRREFFTELGIETHIVNRFAIPALSNSLEFFVRYAGEGFQLKTSAKAGWLFALEVEE